ncbi:hypothetical protein VTN96DRAFT_7395 [Rasamsonia emersonii]|uniref:GPI anchored protein n=1 Tax=Rasamsonia emersonii (strain ATCC 16479 / CBS 393.64 / IMI 116815) TaxID=1408163 RepID=A0A0F4YFF3_RASE3|nr:hypothetical protein T310_9498 [Rasamsonia emersonii CBS 393.64]KKA16884.1 hypothetical protein T310_9498 [Rasamsonia emersonii CBS 393.64]
MVSSRLLLGLATVCCVVQAYPIRSDEDHSHTHSTGLMTRSPDARLKDPFDVDWFLHSLHAFIPTKGDLSQWIDTVIHDSLHYDDDNGSDGDDGNKDNDKNNEVHVENGNKNSNNNNNNPPPAATPAPQGDGKNATNNPSNDDAKDKTDDLFDVPSLLSSLSSLFKGLNAADEIVPS